MILVQGVILARQAYPRQRHSYVKAHPRQATTGRPHLTGLRWGRPTPSELKLDVGLDVEPELVGRLNVPSQKGMEVEEPKLRGYEHLREEN